MQCQNDFMYDIASNIGYTLRSQFSSIKHARLAWPDRKFLSVDGNFPMIVFTDIGIHSKHAVSQLAISSKTSNTIKFEKLRIWILLQITLFTNTREDRDTLGFNIMQYLISNYHIPILDYTQATPSDTGEHMMLYFEHDHNEEKGDANIYQRDLTFRVQMRLLDAVSAYPVGSINQTTQVNNKIDTKEIF